MGLDILLNSKQGVAGQVANETGKRYVCALCGAEFIVTRGGNGTLACCNQPMQLKR
jgi:desulfoferrodoxin-like iron-binding protein